MNEFLQIRQAVMDALKNAGISVLPSFPDRMAGRPCSPVVSVGVGALEGKCLGFCDYLGEAVSEDGRVLERYGKRLDGLVSVDVWAERAADCDRAAELTGGVLLSGLPDGIRPGELRWESLAWDKNAGAFLRKGALVCSALFVADSSGDESLFLDFILKGVLS